MEIAGATTVMLSPNANWVSARNNETKLTRKSVLNGLARYLRENVAQIKQGAEVNVGITQSVPNQRCDIDDLMPVRYALAR